MDDGPLKQALSSFMGPQRCDLHPRWNCDGTLVCVDASHSGVRTQMTLDVTALLKTARADI